MSVNQVLQTIPQLSSFNRLQVQAGQGNAGTVNRPNLRNLEGNAVAGNSTTLILLDGHRLVGAGVNSNSPDPDIIPPGALQRIEVVADGGSAIYGSDAVAGVLNFITRKRFDGLKVDGHYGIADNYHQADISGIVGKDWGSGSAYVSYNYSERGALFGRDRDFNRQFPDEGTGITRGLIDIRCNPGTVSVTNAGVTTFYALPFTTATAPAAANTTNQCDANDFAALYPRETRHSALASISQQFGERITVDLRGFYTKRKTHLVAGPFRQTAGVSVATLNTFFPTRRTGREPTTGSAQSVQYQIGPTDASGQDIDLETWGLTPTLTADLGGGWQLRALGSYGRSDTVSIQRTVNTATINNAINAGLFNPYDPAGSDPAAVAAILNNQTYGRGRQRLADARLILDGELFSLPGGEVKLAAGVEYQHEQFRNLTGTNIQAGTVRTGTPALLLPRAGTNVLTTIVPAVAAKDFFHVTRDIKSAFGELVVPIFGEDNATTLLHELTISVAGRYDDYSDVGHTFNPKYAITWRPVDWIKLRANMGDSFNAPGLADSPLAAPATAIIAPSVPPPQLRVSQGGPYPDPIAGRQTASLALNGTTAGITPQTAKTFSFGADVQPPFIPGLNLSATYYHIKLSNIIAQPSPIQGDLALFRDLPSVIIVNPTLEQINAFLAESVAPAQDRSSGACAAGGGFPTCIYSLQRNQKQNLGVQKVGGIDLSGSYHTDTSFGSLDFGVNGNYELERKLTGDPLTPFRNTLRRNTSKYSLRATAGADIGSFRAQVTANHNAGYTLAPPVGFSGTVSTGPFAGQTFTQQTKVDSFTVVNLFFRYQVPDEGLFRDIELSVNVDNLFDQDPPEFRSSITTGGLGITNGQTIGRFVQFGISKKF